MGRLLARVVASSLLALAGCSSRAPGALHAAAKAAPNAPPAPAAGPCTLTLTAPAAYAHTTGANDLCSVTGAAAGAPHPHDTFLFVARQAAPQGGMLPERSFSIAVDPTLTAGAMVSLTLAGASQLSDQLLVGYDANTVETRCNHFVGTATLVTPRPTLDVKLDVTCQELSASAAGEHLAGEFTSTL
jgi:hypothetical protein